MRSVIDKKMLEKLPEIEELAGIFKIDAKRATKGMTWEKVMVAEKKAIEEGWLDRLK